MFIDTPANTMRLASEKDDLPFLIRRRAAEFYFNNRDAQPTYSDCRVAAANFKDSTGIEIKASELKDILALYPQARISLAFYGPGDTGSEIAAALAHFYVGCEWPTYGDQIDIDAFMSLFVSQRERVRTAIARAAA